MSKEWSVDATSPNGKGSPLLVYLQKKDADLLDQQENQQYDQYGTNKISLGQAVGNKNQADDNGQQELIENHITQQQNKEEEKEGEDLNQQMRKHGINQRQHEHGGNQDNIQNNDQNVRLQEGTRDAIVADHNVQPAANNNNHNDLEQESLLADVNPFVQQNQVLHGEQLMQMRQHDDSIERRPLNQGNDHIEMIDPERLQNQAAVQNNQNDVEEQPQPVNEHNNGYLEQNLLVNNNQDGQQVMHQRVLNARGDQDGNVLYRCLNAVWNCFANCWNRIRNVNVDGEGGEADRDNVFLVERDPEDPLAHICLNL